MVMDVHEIAQLKLDQQQVHGDAYMATLAPAEVERWYGTKIRLVQEVVPSLEEIGDPGPWPDQEWEIDHYRGGLDLKRPPGHELRVLLVPADDAGHVVEALRFGGANGCPPPSVHGAIIRRWNQRWGAEPITMRYDSLTFNVIRPPMTRTEAQELALEHLIYEDVKMEYLSRYAAALLNHPVWCFGWD